MNHFKQFPEAAKWSTLLLHQLLYQQTNITSPPEHNVLIAHLSSVTGLTRYRLENSLRFFGLNTSGKKKILIERLVNHLLGPHRCTYEISWLILASTAAKGDNTITRRFKRTTVEGKQHNAHMRSMRYALLRLLDNAFHKDLFVDDLPNDVVIPFLIYDDASSELSWSVYGSLLGFVIDPAIFKKTASDAKVLHLKPWFLALAPETKNICNQIDKLKSTELKAVVQRPFYVNGHKITFQLRLLCADHSRQWKNIQNKCGGHHR
jgi:hypothetical protein